MLAYGVPATTLAWSSSIEQQVGMALQQRAKLPGAASTDCGAQRVLGAGDGHDRVHAPGQAGLECLGDQPKVVDGDRHGDQSERQQDVTDRRVAGVLDDDAVARPQMRLQDALDPVQRPGHDRERIGGDPVGSERPGRGLEQPLADGIGPARPQLRVVVDPGDRGPDCRQQRRVRQAGREIAPLGLAARGGVRVALAPRCGRRAQRRAGSDPRAPAAVGRREPALAEDPVGRVDGRRALAQPLGQRAHRGQRVAGVEPPVADRCLSAGGDLAGRGAGDLQRGGAPRVRVLGFPRIVLILSYLKHENVL